MSLYRAGVSAVLALLPLCASATTVELTFDVTAHTKYVPEFSRIYGAVWVFDQSFVPQSFTVKARFDLEDAWAYTGRQALTVFSGGSGASVGTTPYSDALRAGMGDAVEHIQASFSGNPVETGWGNPQISSNSALFSATALDQAVTGDVGEFLSYHRTLSFQEYLPAPPPADYPALTGEQFVAWLQGWTGRTVFGYSEQFTRSVSKAVRYGDEWLPSSRPQDRISVEGELLNGDITLRSVSISAVPEPSGMVLMGLGLGLVPAAAAWRRRARAAAD